MLFIPPYLRLVFPTFSNSSVPWPNATEICMCLVRIDGWHSFAFLGGYCHEPIDQLINSLDSIQLTEWQHNSFCGFHGVGFWFFGGVSAFDHFDCFIEIRSTNTIIPKVEIPKVKANTVNALSWEPHKTFTNHPATNPSKKLTGITIIHAHQINHFGFIRISIRCFSQ